MCICSPSSWEHSNCDPPTPGRHSQDLTGLHPKPCSHVLATVQHAWVKEDGENNKGGDEEEEGQEEEAAVGLKRVCARGSGVE